MELRSFIPKLITAKTFPKADENTACLSQADGKEALSYFVRIQNLIKGRENASIIDLKMGVSTVTCNIVNNPKRMQKRLNKDRITTT